LVGALDLPGEGPAPQRLRAALQRGGPDFLEALRQIEIHVSGLPIEEPVLELMQRSYEEALLEPRLNSQRLVWGGLERRSPQDMDMVSELEVKGIGPRLDVEMGSQAREDRKRATAQVGAGGSARTLADVHFKFHHSPKRHLGKQQSFVGELDGRPAT